MGIPPLLGLHSTFRAWRLAALPHSSPGRVCNARLPCGIPSACPAAYLFTINKLDIFFYHPVYRSGLRSILFLQLYFHGEPPTQPCSICVRLNPSCQDAQLLLSYKFYLQYRQSAAGAVRRGGNRCKHLGSVGGGVCESSNLVDTSVRTTMKQIEAGSGSRSMS